jgi:hypothetical protein
MSYADNCAISKYCNWTAVHMNYCDGAVFAGTVAQPIMVQGTPIYFRGRAILDATIDAMLADGLATAKEVIFKGCSAVRSQDG